MKCYIYVTKSKQYLWKYHCISDDYNGNSFETSYSKEEHNSNDDGEILNGKIVASFDLNKIEEIYEKLYGDLDWQHDYLPTTNTMSIVNLEQESCLDREKISKYLKDGKGYAWHIDNLEILEEPLELDNMGLKKAPQSWCYYYYYENNNNPEHPTEEKVIIISIKPEWVCKILNKEKTIEVRKTAPKELIK